MVSVKVCPRCSSRNVEVAKSAAIAFTGYLTPYVCGNCSYSSILFPEVELEKAKSMKVLPAGKFSKMPAGEAETLLPAFRNLFSVGVAGIIVLVLFLDFLIGMLPFTGLGKLVVYIISICIIVYALVRKYRKR